MSQNKLNPRQSLNKSFLRLSAIRNEFDRFKTNLMTLIQQIDQNENEEFHKNIVADFLKNT